MWPSLGPGPNSKSSKTVEVWCSCKVSTLSEQDHHWWNPREKIESALIQKAHVPVHWRPASVLTLALSQEFDARAAAAQYHTKWPRGNSQFQHPAGIKPMSQCYWCSVPPTTKPWILIDLPKQIVYDVLHITSLKQFFDCRIVIVRLFKLNIKARQKPEFLTANLLSIHITAFEIDWTHHWSWIFFSSQSFCSILIEKLINLRKVQKIIKSSNLQILNWSLSNQCRSLNGFQILHFICHLFGCKLWL